MTGDLADAMARIGPTGLFTEADLPILRRKVEASGHSAIDHPAELFGPFEDLRPVARSVLRRAVEDDIRRRMALWPRGAAWTGAVRSARTLDHFLHDRAFPGKLRGRVVRVGELLRGGPEAVARKARARRERKRWLDGRKVSLETLLTVLGKDPHWLLGDFVRDVRVDPRVRGYFHDRPNNVVYGYHVSLDFIPMRDSMVLSEVNLEPGALRTAMENVFGDGLSRGVVESALEQGARRIMWLEARRYGVPDWVLEDLHERVRSAGLKLDLFEDPCMPPRRSEPPGGIPGRWPHLLRPPRDTLVMRRNCYDVGVDYALNHKAALLRGLSAVLEARGERRVRAAPMTYRAPETPLPKHPGLPNVVYKYPEAMSGRGVFFMRVASPARAEQLARQLDAGRKDGPGFFQPFHESQLVEGAIQDIRVWAFLSPREIRFLGAVRSAQGTPVPDSLPEGLVPEDVSFVPKRRYGGHETPMTSEDSGSAEEATRIVGACLQEMIEGTFVTSDG